MPIARLTEADAQAYRTLRLEALATAPEAFGSTHAEESARPLEAFADRIAATAVFARTSPAGLLGMAGFYRHAGPKERHKGGLWGMYVRPEARGTGTAADLVQAVLDQASTQVEQLLLTVIAENTPARRLYTKLGFIEFGLEPRSLLQNGVYYDEVLMIHLLE